MTDVMKAGRWAALTAVQMDCEKVAQTAVMLVFPSAAWSAASMAELMGIRSAGVSVSRWAECSAESLVARSVALLAASKAAMTAARKGNPLAEQTAEHWAELKAGSMAQC